MTEVLPSAPLLPLLYAQALENLLDLAVAIDAQRTVVYVSAGAQRLLGATVSPGAVLDSPSPSDEPPPGGAVNAYATFFLLQALTAEYPVLSPEVVCRCADGQERTLRWRAVSVSSTAGESAGAIAIADVQAMPARPETPWWQEASSQQVLLESIISSMAEGVSVTDAEGRLILRNEAARRITGFDVEQGQKGDEVARRYARLEHGQPIPTGETIRDKNLRGEVVSPVRRSVVTPDGREVFLEGTASPLYDAEEGIQGSVFVFRDVTERKMAELERERLLHELAVSEARLRALVEGLDVGVSVSDGNGRVVVVNRAYREMLGIERDPVGLSVPDVFKIIRSRFAEPDTFESMQILSPTDETVQRSELTITFPRRRVVQRVSSPVLNPAGGVSGRAVVYYDITEHRDLDNLKDEFIGTAAHELRSPLTSVIGYSQLLQKDLARLAPLGATLHEQVGFDPERAAENLATLVQEGRRLNRMISLLLDVSRIRAGRFAVPLRPLDLARLIPREVARLRETITSHPLGYEGPSRRGLMVQGNEDRLGQVLHNLIENAALYSPPGSPIRVRLERVTVGERRAVLSVRDEGIGLTPQDRERIFERMYRVPEAIAHAPGGLGIGLYVCAGIVQQMGGKIWAESEGPDRGSTFYVNLPLAVNTAEGGSGGTA